LTVVELRNALSGVNIGYKRNLVTALDYYNRALAITSAQDGAVETIPAPTYLLAVRPIQAIAPSFTTLPPLLNKLNTELRLKLFETGFVPLHATVFMYFPVSKILRRVVRFDVGNGDDTPTWRELLSKQFTSNLVSFTDVYQDRAETAPGVFTAWESRSVDWNGQSYTDFTYERAELVTVDSGFIPHDIHYVRELMLAAQELEAPYSLLSDSCLHKTMRIVRLFKNNEFPYWLTPKVAARMLLADVTKKYAPQAQPEFRFFSNFESATAITTPEEVVFRRDSLYLGALSTVGNQTAAQIRSSLNQQITAGLASYTTVLSNYIN